MWNNNDNHDTELLGRSLVVALGDAIETVAQHGVTMIFIAHIAGDHENRRYAAIMALICVIL